MYDVVVVGGGPAGAAAALRVLQLRPGARVAIVDKAAWPRDKACGDAIGAPAIDVLRLLGVPDATAGFRPVEHMRLRSPGGIVAARRTARPNWVIPRAVFDARLVRAATDRGAELLRTAVRRIEQRGDHVVLGPDLAARVVVGADGANSTIRRQLGFARNPPGHLAIAVRGYAAIPTIQPTGQPPGQPYLPPLPPEQLIEMTRRGWPAYAWSFPIGDGRANVGFGLLLTTGAEIARQALYGRLAELMPDQPADPASLRAHHLPLSSDRPRQPDGRVLLAGDAASLINPITGEGIYLALESGRLAGEAALCGAQAGAAYRQILHDRLGRHLRHTQVLARMLGHQGFVEAAVDSARRRATVFDAIVDVGLGPATTPAGVAMAIGGRYLAGWWVSTRH